MGDRAQELQASCELIVQLAEQHAGELGPDVAYAKSLVLAAPELLAVCEMIAELLVTFPEGQHINWHKVASGLHATIAQAKGGDV